MMLLRYLLLTILLLLLPVATLAQNVLIYTGEGALSQGYSDFGVVTGKPIITENVLPSDLSPYDCIVLPINRSGFTLATLTALDTYVNSGGRIVAEADHRGFPGAAAAMNLLATHIGADLSIVLTTLDNDFHTTLNIDPSPFTAGVSSIRYAATSEVHVAVGPHAQSLVRTTNSGTTFIGVDKIGSGVFALLGDSNVFSNQNDDGYTNHDNGVLAANICDGVNFGIQAAIDIKFCSDPNAFNCKNKGVLPVTIFGTEDFLVEDIDPSSLQLCTEDLLFCTQAPRNYSYADRGNPATDLGAAMCAINPDTGEEELNPDGYLDLDVAFEASEVKDMLGVFCYLDKGAISDSLVLTGETYNGIPIFSVPLDDVGIERLLKVDKSSLVVDCPCWSDADILALPMEGTDAMCTSDGGRLDIWQDGLCEHSYGVGISPTGFKCVTNRFSCPGLPDLGGEWIETSEIEFAGCLAQIVGRCKELGIDPPEFP